MISTLAGPGTSQDALVYLNNRYHDPTLGTFISVDPLVTITGEAYIYGAANPITYSDPTGLFSSCTLVDGEFTCANDLETTTTYWDDANVHYNLGPENEDPITSYGFSTWDSDVQAGARAGHNAARMNSQPLPGVRGMLRTFAFDLDCSGWFGCGVEWLGVIPPLRWGGEAADGVRWFSDALRWGDEASHTVSRPVVSDARLQNVVRDLYKGTTGSNRVGTGTTADAVRNEILTGLPTGGKFHTQKAKQYSNALRSVLKNGDLSDRDRLVAQSLLDDLQDALRTTP